MNDVAIRKSHGEILKPAGPLNKSEVDQIIANASHEICVFRADCWRYVYVNQSAAENLGYSPSELYRMTPLDIKTGFTSASFAELLRPLQTGEETKLAFSTEHLRKDGSTYPVEVHLHRSYLAGEVVILETIAAGKEQAKPLPQEQEDPHIYREIFQANPVPMWIFDAETLAFLEVNSTAQRKYGYSRSEFLSMSIMDIRPPEEVPRLRNYIATHRDPPTPLLEAGHWKHRLANGEIIDVAITSRNMTRNGRPAVLVMAYDITEWRRSQGALQESEAKYRHLVETAHGLVWSIDRQGRFTYLNRASRRLYGWEPEEMLGRVYTDFVPEDQLEILNSAVPAAIEQNDRLIEFENWMLHRDGHRVLVNSNIVFVRDEQGHVTGATGTTRDVTERRRTSDALTAALQSEKETRRLTEILLDASNTMSSTLDLASVLEGLLTDLAKLINYDSASVYLREGDRLVIAAMRGYEKWGVEMEEKAISYSIDAETSPLDYDIVTNQRSYLLADTRTHARWESPYVGSWIGTPLIHAGQVIGIYSVDKQSYGYFSEDHMKKVELLAPYAAASIRNAQLYQQVESYAAELESRIAERTELLEAKTRQLETFTYSVSHDLKAPLRGIDGYSRLLVEDYASKLDEEGVAFANNIRRATEQMSKLIDDLLAYSRLERRTMHSAKVEIRRLLDDLLNEYRSAIISQGVNVTVDVPDLTVLVDYQGLTMALRNLFDNALKFTRIIEDPRITLRGQQNGECFTLSVRDNGIGFQMQYHDRIFDIFQRLQRSEDYPGTGIGLALVKKAMERMGGTAWAESSPGQGATFYLRFPHGNENNESNERSDSAPQQG